MSERKKRWLTITGLIIVCIILVFGISRVLYREPEREVLTTDTEPEDTGTVINTEIPAEDRETEETEESERDIIINTELVTVFDGTEQVIQADPEKTEDERPQEPPALQEGADIEDPTEPPVYEEPKEDNNSPQENNASAHGNADNGMIYVEGFGWIPNEGGGGSGTTANDMYENGNTIGIMD